MMERPDHKEMPARKVRREQQGLREKQGPRVRPEKLDPEGPVVRQDQPVLQDLLG